MDRGAWRATVYGDSKSQTWLSNSHTHTHTHRKQLYSWSAPNQNETKGHASCKHPSLLLISLKLKVTSTVRKRVCGGNEKLPKTFSDPSTPSTFRKGIFRKLWESLSYTSLPPRRRELSTTASWFMTEHVEGVAAWEESILETHSWLSYSSVWGHRFSPTGRKRMIT